ncbi:phosphoserine phosphatase SerB [Parasphingopyxis marina]|uniref:Phosphoserine phosphatase n=1 Tax=Parasphingopyxis marina TaxID=2761622 RepID=A0A842HYV3_9SPHN|nr:phosphoserine phosphatase SerB [Parasphingopyxis marina]MBC2778112.1 phosphoserine phosphatase SerB [Parasphingopyxis marina]
MFIATLIAADRLAAGDISRARDALAAAGTEPGEAAWLEAEKAADIPFAGDPAAARGALDALGGGTDHVVQAAENRRKKLFVADMDSTMITVECLDELADYAGFKDHVAAITERAMRGELDFIEALDERVSLLKGLSSDIVTQCHEERVRLMAGGPTLVRTMKAHGARCVLVSGGFTLFADRVAADIGFDRAIANTLVIENGALTGAVARPVVDSATKERVLGEESAALGLQAAETLAIGDGANDLAMIRKAGLGIAYYGKPKLREAADARIDHGDLTALLYAQGYRREDWVAEA